MARKETLEMKKAVSEAIVGETKRCLAIIKRTKQECLAVTITPDTIKMAFDEAIKKTIKDCPCLKFHPELLKKLPKS